MQNAKDDTCVLGHKPITQSMCESDLAFSNIGMLKLKGTPEAADSDATAVGLGTVAKFDLNTFKVADDAETVIAETDFLTPTFSQTVVDPLVPTSDPIMCGCDNFVLEAHYKVYFDQDPETANSYFIKDFKVDVVYGKIELECSESYTFNLKTSVMYLQNEGDRVFSGSPGYLRGSPVLIGETYFPDLVEEEDGSTTQPQEQIKLNQHGFPLRGAQYDGTCYYVDQLVSDPEVSLSGKIDLSANPLNAMLINDADEKTYFEDPILSFEDSTIYGCSL